MLNASTIAEYYQAINIIEGREALIQLKIADFPWHNKQVKRRVWKWFQDLAYPHEERQTMSGNAAEHALRAMGY